MSRIKRTFFVRYWWVFAGVLSAVAVSTALNITNTDSWIVVTNPSNDSWVVNWNTSRPTTCSAGNYSYWTGTGFACAPDQAGSANLSGYVPYTGATQNVNINGYILQTHGVRSTDSAGLLIESASGTDSALFGVANTANILFYGSLDMSAGTNICLGGVCRTTWPADTYANVTVLQTANVTTNTRVDSVNTSVSTLSTFAQTKAATGSIDCGAGNFLRVLTISNGSWTTTCAADQSGGGGAGFTPYNPAYYFQDFDFESVTAAYTNIWVPTAIGAGTTAVINGEANRPGLVTISSSATASSGYSYQLANAAAYLLTNGSGTKTIVAPITKTGNVTICRFGYQDSFTTTLPTDGLFWNVTQSASGSAVYNFMGVARNNNAQTNTSVFAYTTTTTQYFKLETYVVNTTLAQFTIVNSTNGAILAGPLNVTTNIPTSVGRETSHANLCYVNGATTAVVLARLDYTSVYNNATTFTR